MKIEPGALKRALVPLGVALLAWGHITGAAFHWTCPIRSLLHIPCPTCGMTTATRAMLRLDFIGAERVHPLSIVVVPFVAVLVAIELGGYVATAHFGTWTNHRGDSRGAQKLKSAVRIAGLAMCAALFCVWIARFFGAFGGVTRV